MDHSECLKTQAICWLIDKAFFSFFTIFPVAVILAFLPSGLGSYLMGATAPTSSHNHPLMNSKFTIILLFFREIICPLLGLELRSLHGTE